MLSPSTQPTPRQLPKSQYPKVPLNKLYFLPKADRVKKRVPEKSALSGNASAYTQVTGVAVILVAYRAQCYINSLLCDVRLPARGTQNNGVTIILSRIDLCGVLNNLPHAPPAVQRVGSIPGSFPKRYGGHHAMILLRPTPHAMGYQVVCLPKPCRLGYDGWQPRGRKAAKYPKHHEPRRCYPKNKR